MTTQNKIRPEEFIRQIETVRCRIELQPYNPKIEHLQQMIASIPQSLTYSQGNLDLARATLLTRP